MSTHTWTIRRPGPALRPAAVVEGLALCGIALVAVAVLIITVTQHQPGLVAVAVSLPGPVPAYALLGLVAAPFALALVTAAVRRRPPSSGDVALGYLVITVALGIGQVAAVGHHLLPITVVLAVVAAVAHQVRTRSSRSARQGDTATWVSARAAAGVSAARSKTTSAR